MRKLITIVVLLASINVSATDYYVASTGNDGASGLNEASAWQSIPKINSSFSSFVNGDRILFRRGDTFHGCIYPNKSFAQATPLIFTSYGTGADPIITGFSSVASWTSLGANIWESSSAVSTLADMNMLTINGVAIPMGRLPNTGWLTHQSHTSTTLTSTSLNATTTNWTGADVVMKPNHFTMQRNLITGASGSTITFVPDNSESITDGTGFFITNDVRTLDLQNEWYYNPTTKKVRIYSTTTPTNVTVSSLDTLVYIVYQNGFKFDSLQFSGANERAFYLGSASDVTIQNCHFYNQGLFAVWGGNNWGTASTGFNFNHNKVNWAQSKAIELGDEFKGYYIGYNDFRNIGTVNGMAKNPDKRFDWAMAFGVTLSTGVEDATIEHNFFDSTGYSGFMVSGSGIKVRYNIGQNFGLNLMDCGGISAGGSNGRIDIDHNIMFNGYGDNSGTSDPINSAHGIILDAPTDSANVHHNIMFNNGFSGFNDGQSHNSNFYENVMFNNKYTQYYAGGDYGVGTPSDVTFSNNTLVAKAPEQLVYYWLSNTLETTNALFTKADSNVLARPIDDNLTLQVKTDNYSNQYDYSLAGFRSAFGYETHSTKSPKAITDTSDFRFEYNATMSDKVVDLGGTSYIDMKGNEKNGTLTLQPFTSIILLKSGSYTPPVIGGQDSFPVRVNILFKNN